MSSAKKNLIWKEGQCRCGACGCWLFFSQPHGRPHPQLQGDEFQSHRETHSPVLVNCRWFNFKLWIDLLTHFFSLSSQSLSPRLTDHFSQIDSPLTALVVSIYVPYMYPKGKLNSIYLSLQWTMSKSQTRIRSSSRSAQEKRHRMHQHRLQPRKQNMYRQSNHIISHHQDLPQSCEVHAIQKWEESAEVHISLFRQPFKR